MAFAVPKLSSFVFNDPLKKTTRKLTLLITRTSQQALTTSQPYTLKYDTQSRSFTARPVADVGISDDNTKSWQKLSLPDTVKLTDITLSSEEVFSNSTATLYFSKKGYLQPCLIHLQNTSGDAMTLKLSPFMGKVTVYNQYVSLAEDTFR